MKPYSIPVDWSAMEQVVTGVLVEDLERLKDDLIKVAGEQKGFVFSLDYRDDMNQLIELIDAYKKVLDYYGVWQ